MRILFMFILLTSIVALFYLLKKNLKRMFVLMLAASIIATLYLLKTELDIIGHNHFAQRYSQLDAKDATSRPAWAGVTRAELSLCPDRVKEAYISSVNDAYRMGNGNSALFYQCFALIILLFVTSLVGIQNVDRQNNTVNRIPS